MQHPTPLAKVVEKQGRRVDWLAAQLDPPVDPSTVSRWCNGKREIPRFRFPQLAALLGVPVEELSAEKAGSAA